MAVIRNKTVDYVGENHCTSVIRENVVKFMQSVKFTRRSEHVKH